MRCTGVGGKKKLEKEHIELAEHAAKFGFIEKPVIEKIKKEKRVKGKK